VPQKEIAINLKREAYFAKNNDTCYSIYITSANNKHLMLYNFLQLICKIYCDMDQINP